MGSFSIEKDLLSNTNDASINFLKEKTYILQSERFDSSATYIFKGPTGYSIEDAFPVNQLSTKYLYILDSYLISADIIKYLTKYFNNKKNIQIQEDPLYYPIFLYPNIFSAINESGNIGFISTPSGVQVLNKINNDWLTTTYLDPSGFSLGIRDLKCNSSGNILFASTPTGVNIFTGYFNDWKYATRLTGDNEPNRIDCNKDGNIISFGSVVSFIDPYFPPDTRQINSGAIYIWKEQNANWALKSTITGTGFDFGRSISMDAFGNKIVTSCTRASSVDGLSKSGQLTIITGNQEEWKISQTLTSDLVNDNYGYISKINKIGDRIFCSAYNGPQFGGGGGYPYHDKSKIYVYTGDKIFFKTSELSGIVNIAPYPDTPLYELRPGFGYDLNTNEDGNVLFVGSFVDVIPYKTTSYLYVYEKEFQAEAWKTGIMGVGQKIALDKYGKNFIIGNSLFKTSFNSGYYYTSYFPPEIEIYENITNNKISFYKEYNYWTDYNAYKTGGYILPIDCKIKFLNFNNSGVNINNINPNLQIYKNGSDLYSIQII